MQSKATATLHKRGIAWIRIGTYPFEKAINIMYTRSTNATAQTERSSDANLTVEEVDDRVRRAAKISEDMKNRLAVYRREAGLIDHYLKVNACLGLRCVRGEFEQGGFVFQRLRPGEEDFRLRSHSNQYKPIWFGHYREHPFMLTNNIKLM